MLGTDTHNPTADRQTGTDSEESIQAGTGSNSQRKQDRRQKTQGTRKENSNQNSFLVNDTEGKCFVSLFSVTLIGDVGLS